ncbi:MAG: conjugal transfer protein TraI, partial [Segetibacter sp.]|nr:conjugal transfer protein TraI [Segetibacter sp.]
MKKLVISLGIMVSIIIAPAEGIQAQDPITLVIKEGIKKVIKVVDLKIQRQQNKIIWLQNVQKTLENAMSKTKLNQISDWVEKQRTLYKDYFNELQK